MAQTVTRVSLVADARQIIRLADEVSVLENGRVVSRERTDAVDAIMFALSNAVIAERIATLRTFGSVAYTDRSGDVVCVVAR